MKVYTLFDPPPRVRLDCAAAGPSLTKQWFADECDINQIVRRYEAAGGRVDQLGPDARGMAFGDFSGVQDYLDCQNRLLAGQEAFQSLPAEVRDRFGNAPERLLDWLSEEKNHDEAVALGILAARSTGVPERNQEAVGGAGGVAEGQPVAPDLKGPGKAQ